MVAFLHLDYLAVAVNRFSDNCKLLFFLSEINIYYVFQIQNRIILFFIILEIYRLYVTDFLMIINIPELCWCENHCVLTIGTRLVGKK